MEQHWSDQSRVAVVARWRGLRNTSSIYHIMARPCPAMMGYWRSEATTTTRPERVHRVEAEEVSRSEGDWSSEDEDEDGLCADVDSCPFDKFNDDDSDLLCADVDSCPFDGANDEDSDSLCTDTRSEGAHLLLLSPSPWPSDR